MTATVERGKPEDWDDTAEVERLNAVISAKQAWIDGAKVDLDAAITWQDAADYLRQNAPQEHESANACEACAWLTAIAMLELRGKS